MAEHNMLRAGFARTDITPEPGVRLGGYGVKERPAEEITDRLHSTALVLEQNDLKAVMDDYSCIGTIFCDKPYYGHCLVERSGRISVERN